ncbi:unnamed protein product [Calypogeia fissa]
MASRRNPGWLVMTLALLYLTVSLQVGLSSADASGSCLKVNCGSGYCCSANYYCGTSELYCGPGCTSGPCFTNASDPLGSCPNDTCAPGLCCSQFNFCGSNSSYCGAGCLSGPCYNSSAGGTTLSGRSSSGTGSSTMAGFALACVLGTMTFLGTVFWNRPNRGRSICWGSGGWLLAFAILCMAVSLQMGVSKADTGSCINHACDTDLCCSENFYCGATDDYCGLGCRGGACSTLVNATPGSCVNQACASGLCCNADFTCGSNATDCGAGCQGGLCNSNSGDSSLASALMGSSNFANAGLAFAYVLGTLTFLNF